MDLGDAVQARRGAAGTEATAVPHGALELPPGLVVLAGEAEGLTEVVQGGREPPVGDDISASRSASRAATTASAYRAAASSRWERLTSTRAAVTTSPVRVAARSASSRCASFRAPVVVRDEARWAAASACGSPTVSATRRVSVASACASSRRPSIERSWTRQARHSTPTRSVATASASTLSSASRAAPRSPSVYRAVASSVASCGFRAGRRWHPARAGRERGAPRHRHRAGGVRQRGYAGRRACSSSG